LEERKLDSKKECGLYKYKERSEVWLGRTLRRARRMSGEFEERRQGSDVYYFLVFFRVLMGCLCL